VIEKPWLAHYDEGVPPRLDYPKIALHQTLEDSARRYPTRPPSTWCCAISDHIHRARLSYGQVMDQVNRFALALGALGVRKGDRVALLLPTCRSSSSRSMAH